jgi:hypothetical protein
MLRNTMRSNRPSEVMLASSAGESKLQLDGDATLVGKGNASVSGTKKASFVGGEASQIEIEPAGATIWSKKSKLKRGSDDGDLGSRCQDQLITSASSNRPERSDVRSSGPPLATHSGSLLAGGIMWLAPIIFLPAALLSFGQERSFAFVMAAMGVGTAAPLVAARRQTVELFHRHLVWTKWGRARTIAYSDIREIRSGKRAQKAEGARTGLIEQRFLDLYLRDGEKVIFIEMARHEALSRQLAGCLTAFHQAIALGAAGRERRGRDVD